MSAASRHSAPTAPLVQQQGGYPAYANNPSLKDGNVQGGSQRMSGPSSTAVAAAADALFMCPITQEMMQDPVMAADGYTWVPRECDAVTEAAAAGNASIPILVAIRPSLSSPHLKPPPPCTAHRYDRSSITLWLQTHNTSPMTNAQLPHKNLTPNHALRSSIMEYKESLQR